MPTSYVVRMPATAVTTAKTLIQIATGDTPITILDARVEQVTKTAFELLNVQILRKTAPATVTAATPLKLATLDAASLSPAGVAGTGYNATAEGSDGDILEDLVWNVLTGSWSLQNIDDEIVIPPNSFIALKLMIAPAASMSIAATVKFKEVPRGFGPSQVPGLKLWLRSDAIVGLVDGDPIATWPDRSGNGYNGTQASASQKPTYKTAILNGRPVVRFDGTDDNLQVVNAAWPWGQLFTFFAVMAPTNSDWTIFGGQTGGTSGVNMSFGAAIWGTPGLWGAYYLGVGVAYTSTVTFSSAFHVYEFGDISTTGEAYQDGVSNVVTASTFGSSLDGLIANAIGARNVGGFGTPFDSYLTGDVAEIIIYSRSLTTAERNSVTAYLGAKYAISVV